MKPLIILGGSVRAAAFSALRGGYQPYCADLFADADVSLRCSARLVADYPAGLATALETYPNAPWLYTGGLENHPRLVNQMAASRPLLGNAGAVLRRVRDPLVLSAMLNDCACRFPDWQATAAGLPTDGSWLRKGYRSTGGLQVHAWTGQSADNPSEYYWQRRLHGRPAAALCVATAGECVLLGVTEQWVGHGKSDASDSFGYSGSIGPLPLERHQHAALLELGQTLASRAGVQGVFGIDVILANDGIYAVDVNPRYPASAEVLERALGFSAVALHVAACEAGRLPSPATASDRCCGKAILYAERPLTVDEQRAELLRAAWDTWPWPPIADAPAAGTSIRAGSPVMTVFAENDSAEGVARRLAAALDHWRGVLWA